MSKEKFLVIFLIHESSSKFGDVLTTIIGTEEFRRKFLSDYLRPSLLDEDGVVKDEKSEELLRQLSDVLSRSDLFIANKTGLSFDTLAGRQFNILLSEFDEKTSTRINMEVIVCSENNILDMFEELPPCVSKSASTT